MHTKYKIIDKHGVNFRFLPTLKPLHTHALEAIEQRNWKEAQEQIAIAATAINSFTAYLESAIVGLK